jgi:O-antigen ligase
MDTALYISSFLLPFFQTGSFICWGLIFFIQLIHKESRLQLVSSLGRCTSFWWMPLFWLVHLIGMLWSENQAFGWKDIETKLSFLLLPILFASMPVTSERMVKIQRSFVAGVMIAVVFLLSKSITSYLQDKDSGHFYYARLSSALMHPTYLGMYVALALYLVADDWFISGKKPWRTYHFPLVLLFSGVIFLLSSRSVILAVGLLLPVFCLARYVKSNAGSLKPPLVVLALILAFFINARVNTHNNRMAELGQSIQQAKTGAEHANNSVNSRFEIWRQALSLFKTAPFFGYGTGDVKDCLMESYHASHFTYALEKKLNAHNQYLQTSVALGFLGLLSLLAFLLLPLYPFRFSPFSFFIGLILLNALTESIFETQKGVVFSAFFYAVYISFETRHAPNSNN